MEVQAENKAIRTGEPEKDYATRLHSYLAQDSEWAKEYPDVESFRNKIQSDSEYTNRLYDYLSQDDLFKKDYTNSEMFAQAVIGAKKKDESDLDFGSKNIGTQKSESDDFKFYEGEEEDKDFNFYEETPTKENQTPKKTGWELYQEATRGDDFTSKEMYTVGSNLEGKVNKLASSSDFTSTEMANLGTDIENTLPVIELDDKGKTKSRKEYEKERNEIRKQRQSETKIEVYNKQISALEKQKNSFQTSIEGRERVSTEAKENLYILKKKRQYEIDKAKTHGLMPDKLADKVINSTGLQSRGLLDPVKNYLETLESQHPEVVKTWKNEIENGVMGDYKQLQNIIIPAINNRMSTLATDYEIHEKRGDIDLFVKYEQLNNQIKKLQERISTSQEQGKFNISDVEIEQRLIAERDLLMKQYGDRIKPASAVYNEMMTLQSNYNDFVLEKLDNSEELKSWFGGSLKHLNIASAEALESFDNVAKFILDYTGYANLQVDKDLLTKDGIFTKMGNSLRAEAEHRKDLPSTKGGRILGGIMDVTPAILMTSFFPEAKMPTSLVNIGVKTVPRFAMVETHLHIGRKYDELLKETKGKRLNTEQLAELIKEGEKGFITGYAMHLISEPGTALAKIVGKQVPKFFKATSEAVTSTQVTGMGFASLDIMNAIANGEKIDWEQVQVSYGTGVGLGLYGIFRSMVADGSSRKYLIADKEFKNIVDNVEYTPRKINEDIKDIEKKIINTKSEKKRKPLLAKYKFLNELMIYKIGEQEIAKDKDDFLRAIESDENLSRKEKDYYKGRIEEAEFDIEKKEAEEEYTERVKVDAEKKKETTTEVKEEKVEKVEKVEKEDIKTEEEKTEEVLSETENIPIEIYEADELIDSGKISKNKLNEVISDTEATITKMEESVVSDYLKEQVNELYKFLDKAEKYRDEKFTVKTKDKIKEPNTKREVRSVQQDVESKPNEEINYGEWDGRVIYQSGKFGIIGKDKEGYFIEYQDGSKTKVKSEWLITKNKGIPIRDAEVVDNNTLIVGDKKIKFESKSDKLKTHVQERVAEKKVDKITKESPEKVKELETLVDETIEKKRQKAPKGKPKEEKVESETKQDKEAKEKVESKKSKIEDLEKLEEEAEKHGDDTMESHHTWIDSENDYRNGWVEKYTDKKYQEDLSESEKLELDRDVKDYYKEAGYYGNDLDYYVGTYEEALRSYWGESKEAKEIAELEDVSQKEEKVESTEEEKADKVESIKSKKLTHVSGIKMGQSQAEGFYLSTEKENRYATEDKKSEEYEADIENPIEFDQNKGEFADMQREILNKNKEKFTEGDYQMYEKKEGEITVDDLSDAGTKKLAKLVTEDLKKKGYDSIHFMGGGEGELVVFDKDKVKKVAKETDQTKDKKQTTAKPKKTGGRAKVLAELMDLRDKGILKSAKKTKRKKKGVDFVPSKEQKITKEEVHTMMRLNDAIADVWAEKMGKTRDEYYDEHIGQIIEGKEKIIPKGKAKPKGAIQFTKDNKAIVSLFESSNVTTLAHEFIGGHVGEKVLKELAEVDKEFAKDYEAVKEWAGVKHGKWNRNSKEKFARGWERYLRTGKAPTKELRTIFGKLKEWFTNVYKKIAGSDIDVKVPKNIEKVFGRMLGEKGEIKETDNILYETKSKKYRVVKSKGGLVDVTDVNGVKPSKPTQANVLKEYVKNTTFEGKTANERILELMDEGQFESQKYREEQNADVIDLSENPYELAVILSRTDEYFTDRDRDGREEAINKTQVPIDLKEYSAMTGWAEDVQKAMIMKFQARKGEKVTGVDIWAQQANSKSNYEDITPDHIYSFLQKYAKQEFERQHNPVYDDLANRFVTVTGFNPTPTLLKELLQHKKAKEYEKYGYIKRGKQTQSFKDFKKQRTEYDEAISIFEREAKDEDREIEAIEIEIGKGEVVLDKKKGEYVKVKKEKPKETKKVEEVKEAKDKDVETDATELTDPLYQLESLKEKIEELETNGQNRVLSKEEVLDIVSEIKDITKKKGLTEVDYKSILGKLEKTKTTKTAKRATDRAEELVAKRKYKNEKEEAESLLKKKLNPKRFIKTKNGKQVSTHHDPVMSRFYDNVVRLNANDEIRIGNEIIKIPKNEERRKVKIAEIQNTLDNQLDKLDKNEIQTKIDDIIMARRALEFMDITKSDDAEIISQLKELDKVLKGKDMAEYKAREIQYSEKRGLIKDILKDKKGKGFRHKGKDYGNHNTNSLFDILGGRSENPRLMSNPIHEALKTEKGGINDSELKYKKLRKEWDNKFKAVFDKVFKKHFKKSWNIAEMGIVKPTKIERVLENGEKEYYTISVNQAIQMYMQLKDPALKESMMQPKSEKDHIDGNGLTEESIKEIEKYIGAEGREIAKEMFPLYEELYEMQNDIYRRMEGRDLGKVDFYSGSVVRSHEMAEFEMGDFRGVSKMSLGSHKARVKNNGYIEPIDFIETYSKYMDEVVNYVAFKEITHELNRTLLNTGVQNRIRDIFGDNMVEELKWQKDLLAGDVTINSSLFDIVNKQARKGILYLKMSTGLKQTASMVMYMHDMPLHKLLSGTGEMATMLVAKKAGVSNVDTEILKTIKDNPIVSTRNINTVLGLEVMDKNLDRSLLDRFGGFMGEKLAEKNSKLLRKIQAGANLTKTELRTALDIVGGAFMKGGDILPMIATGSAYAKHKGGKYKGSKITTEDVKNYNEGIETKGSVAFGRAIRDWVVVSEATQQSSFRSNVARNRVSSGFRRGFNQYTSAQHQQYVMVRSAYRDIEKGIRTKNKKLVRKGTSVLTSFFTMIAAIEYISTKGEGEPDDYLKSLLFGLTVHGVPFVYPAAMSADWAMSGLLKGYSPKRTTGIPGVDLITDGAIEVGKLIAEGTNSDFPDKEKMKRYRNKAATLFAVANGLPADNVGKTIDGWKRVIEGSSDNTFFDLIGQGKKGVMIAPNKDEKLSEYRKRMTEKMEADNIEVTDKKKDAMKAYYYGGAYTKMYLNKYENPLTYNYSAKIMYKIKYMEKIAENLGGTLLMVVNELEKFNYGNCLMSRQLLEVAKEYAKNPEKYKKTKDFEMVKKTLGEKKKKKKSIDWYEN